MRFCLHARFARELKRLLEETKSALSAEVWLPHVSTGTEIRMKKTAALLILSAKRLSGYLHLDGIMISFAQEHLARDKSRCFWDKLQRLVTTVC